MIFSSPFFVFAFLPLFLLSFFFSRARYRNLTLFTISIIFYFWGEPTFCLVAIASAVFDYTIVSLLYRNGTQNNKAKFYVVLGVASNLLILGYYKYSNFFLTTFSHLFLNNQSFNFFTNIVLPIGVSFIVFEKITYVVDVYRGISKPADSLLNYLTYIFFFPKLLAGPIIKYHEIEKQLSRHKIIIDNIAEGFKRFLMGLAKKVFIADICGSAANQIFALSGQQLSFTYAWIGILSFTLQIYFDFSAYSDIAIGLARMFGFSLRENFNMPYISANFTEFWRRWHISLSTWIREYLYIPLGGNRVKPIRAYLNLWICFLLSGLWHGANWTFVLWGAYNGLFLTLDKLGWIKISRFFPRIINAIITFFFVMIGWVIFRSQSFNQMKYYFSALAHPAKHGSAYIDLTPDIFTAIIIGFCLVVIPLLPGYKQLVNLYQRSKIRVTAEGVLFSLIGFLSICKIVGTSYVPFFYFHF